jgi:hypothetical protein
MPKFLNNSKKDNQNNNTSVTSFDVNFEIHDVTKRDQGIRVIEIESPSGLRMAILLVGSVMFLT